MTFLQTLVRGTKDLFKPDTLTPMQKMTRRFVGGGRERLPGWMPDAAP